MATIASMDVRLAMDSADFDQGIAKAQASAESFSKKLSSVGQTMSLAVTAPLAGIAGMALKSAGDFESSMNVMQSVTGATGGQMAALQAQALELGASTSFSAGEAAEAMLELGKAGLDATDIMGAMPGVLSLAAAGGMDVANAATIAANTVNTFGLAAIETTAVANMLAAAANASSADVTDLAAGMQMAGAVFASNQQSLSDLTTAMSLMANAGIAGSDAGTSLKTMMMRLAAPTQEAADAMSALGLNMYNLDGSMRPFQDVIADLGTATSGLSDAQRNAALNTIFGADAIRAATILTSAGAESWSAMEAAVNQAGAAQEAAGARMKGLSGAMEYLKGSIDSAMIAMSGPFLTTIADMLRGVADLVTGFTALPPELQNAALAFGAVMAAAGPVMLAISGIGTALGFLLSPIGLLVVAIAGLAAAWATNFGGIRDITAEVAAQLAPAFSGVLATVQGMTTAFAATLPSIQGVAAAMLDAGVNSIEATEAITALPAGLQPVATAFQSLFATLTAAGVALQTFLAPAIARVQAAFAGLAPSLGALAGPLAELQAAFATLWSVAQPILAQLAAAIGVTLAIAADAGINTIAAVITNLPALIGPAIRQVSTTIELIATTVQGVADLVTAIINGDWDAAWKAAQNITAGFSTYFTNTVANWQAIASAVFETIKQIVSSTLTDMGTSIESVMGGISAFWTGIWEEMSKAVQPVLDAIDGLKKGIQAFQGWISSISIPNPFAGIQMPSLPALPSLPGFAAGGPVSSGAPVIVGERGPELFVPNRAGTIIPNHEVGGAWAEMSGGSAGGVAINNYGDFVSPIDLAALAQQVAQFSARRR